MPVKEDILFIFPRYIFYHFNCSIQEERPLPANLVQNLEYSLLPSLLISFKTCSLSIDKRSITQKTSWTTKPQFWPEKRLPRRRWSSDHQSDRPDIVTLPSDEIQGNVIP